MVEILGLDSLFAEMIFGVGLALVVGNLFALWKHRRGERPDGVEGKFRAGRVAFLLVVGALMAAWGGATIFG
jgi:hypothetical protein